MFLQILLKTLRENKILWILYGLFFLFGLVGSTAVSREQSLLWVNGRHSPIFDFIFKYWTFLGDGIFYIFITVLLFLYRRNLGFIALACFVVSTLITYILKHFIFDNIERPPGVIPNYILHFIPGEKVEWRNSFPSGHATTVFALVFVMSVILRSQFLKILIFFIGLIAIYTRMYMAKHFLIDITFGSFIGMVFSLFTFIVIQFFLSNGQMRNDIFIQK